MPDLRISIDGWTGAGQGPREETVTSGLLRIEAAGSCLTRNDSSWSQSVVDWVHVSVYPAALWLAANWWRICFEPASRFATSRTRDSNWRAAHELAAAGGGFLWPPIEIVGDGEQVFLSSRPRGSGRQPIRYFETVDLSVPFDEFQTAAASFVDVVVERLRAADLVDTELEALWQELQVERADPDTARARRFEAAMHCDPDEAPPAGLAALDTLTVEAGTDAAHEIAAALQGADAVATLARLRSVAQNGESVRGSWNPGAELAARCRRLAGDTTRPPWHRGVEAARAARHAWQLNEERVDSTALAARLDMPAVTLGTVGTGVGAPIALAIRSGTELRWMLRAAEPRARRFEAARLVGDLLASPVGDAWHPATEFRTARQKFQRAFAAEFLCPADGLRSFLGDDRSDDAIVAAARHFDVHEQAVLHQVQNHLDRV